MTEETAVLCVDDDPSVLSALRRTLRHEPYGVVTVSDAASVLERLARHPVNVVVADERMPRIAGSELLAEIHRRWPWMGLIILTGFPGQSVAIRGMEANVDFLLSKPWDDESLRKTIRRLVREVDRSRPGSGEWLGFDIGGEGG